MREFLASVCIICLLSGGVCYSAPEDYSLSSEQTQTDDVIDELVNPESETQPNGSDIKPDKVYTQAEYEQIYRDLEVPTFTFIHGVDPDQYYDMKDTAWSPYPLMRLNSPIYFKSITI